MNFDLFINGLSLSFACTGVLLSLMFLLLISIRIRPLKSNVPLILTCNTYLTSLILSILMLKASSQTIYGILHSSLSSDGVNCQVNGYFTYTALGNVFYSFILQAIFRLVRVVFYRKKFLHSFRVFSIAIIIQWILSFLLNLPFLLFKDFEYISTEYRCQVSYTNFRGCFMVLVIEYGIPTDIMFAIYYYIIRYIRRTNNGMINRSLRNRHDVIVIKETFIIFIAMLILTIPLSVLWLLYIIGNYLTPLSYQLQGLAVAFSQSFIPIALAFSTPQIREKFKWRRRRIHPIVRDRFHRNENIRTIAEQRF